MQAETRILFKEESESILNALTAFNKKELKRTTTTVRHLPVVYNAMDPRKQRKQLNGAVHEKKGIASSPTKGNQPQPMKGATLTQMHGRCGAKMEGWKPPLTVMESQEIARPGYDDVTTASEYNDDPDTLRRKVKVLADMIRQSKAMCTYTGAGISTSSGIDDYASKGTAHSTFKVKSPYDAQPTKAHFVLTALHKAGLLKHWIQQNHDGLPQKAGFPQRDLNEIHGAWYDPSNPVVMMSGQLRSDLFEWLLQWEERADLVLTLGTSLSGMNADRMVVAAAKRQQESKGQGAVIVSLQRTKLDDMASLRIFATIDQTMTLLAEELKLQVGQERHSLQAEPASVVEENVFLVPYDKNGQRLPKGAGRGAFTALDLREDAEVRITMGQFKGDRGVVVNQNREGHYRVQFRHEIGGKRGRKSFKAPMMRVYGSWWVEAATKGELSQLPVVNVQA
jgi:NAD-dependent SIR2 family protein deacetylase